MPRWRRKLREGMYFVTSCSSDTVQGKQTRAAEGLVTAVNH